MPVKTVKWSSKMSQRVKTSAAKPDNLSLSLRTHMVEAEN